MTVKGIIEEAIAEENARERKEIEMMKAKMQIKVDNFVKNDSGKLQWSILPFEQLEDVVRVLMRGAETYTRDNWQKCDDPNRYVDALMRHVIAYKNGEKLDTGTGGDGLPHLAHAVCNCLFLMWFDTPHKQEIEK